MKPKGPLHILCLAILAVPIPAFLGCAGHVCVNEEAILEIEFPVSVFLAYGAASETTDVLKQLWLPPLYGFWIPDDVHGPRGQ